MTSFHLETYGCSHNFADSEQMAGLLQQAKFEYQEKLEDADIIIFNTCTVKGPTESAFYTRLEEIKNQFPYKIIIIAGCIPQSDPGKLKKFSLLGTRQIHHIVEVVEEALHDNVVQLLETGEMPPLNLPKIRKNPVVEIIPISRGCLSRCTFCKTKQARGNLESYPVVEIVSVAAQALREGVKEIWLTSQDTGCYGFDLGTNLVQLLKELISLPGEFKIRIGMGNPLHFQRYYQELFPLLNDPHLFQFLHLPAQSGSNAILKAMRRGNTNEEFLSLVEELRQRVPLVTLATDIIVGFPGETEEDHQATVSLLRKTTPDVVNISRFWPRPGTPAAVMEQLPIEIIQQRTKVITEIFQNISKMQNERWLDWEGEMVITEKGSKPGQWCGRNFAYKPVLVESNGRDYRLGEKIAVKIDKAGTFDLRGTVRKVR
ncbi:MAG: tRNA (N(6)-L-threonylcarbamoyladenosine(37)-C(2))-methylthiotransferase [Nanoarchaeota archaeon]